MEGIDLQGSMREIPDAFGNQFNIVVLAFEREQQADVNTWIEATESLISENKNISFFEVPLIYELSAPYRTWVNNGMRSGIQEERARSRTITVYTDREEFLKIMNMKPEEIYALILDNEGKILWREEGLANEEKMRSLRRIIIN